MYSVVHSVFSRGQRSRNVFIPSKLPLLRSKSQIPHLPFPNRKIIKGCILKGARDQCKAPCISARCSRADNHKSDIFRPTAPCIDLRDLDAFKVR